MHKGKNILIVCPYPFGEAPSQRFRFEQYLNRLTKAGFNYRIAPFLSEDAWQILYKKGSILKKIWAIISGFGKRKWLLLELKPYDIIFIHREATPIGPPFFEWIVRFIWQKPIIYDFDDAIWLEDSLEKGNLKSILKWKSKVGSICKWSAKVSCGNQYLADYAKLFNQHVIVNPTTIDTDGLHIPNDVNTDELTIGWTGTHSTLPYLEHIIESLKVVYKETPFKLRVIANHPPNFSFPNLEFITWNKETEILDLQGINIGLMPLTNDPWSKGKCGFKALQYMALEKVVIGSPVGVNKEIIPKGGLLANSEKEWIDQLTLLLIHEELRKELGIEGRRFIKNHFSVQSNADNFLYLFE